MRFWTLLVLVTCAAGCAANPGGAARHQVARPKMKQIHFVRSGGFAGMATRVTGTLNFGDGAAEVRSEDGRYSRTLGETEAASLRNLDPTALSKLKDTRKTRVPDGYQYDITVETGEGKSHTFTIGGESAPELEKIAPGLGALADLIRKEANNIWAKKVR